MAAQGKEFLQLLRNLKHHRDTIGISTIIQLREKDNVPN